MRWGLTKRSADTGDNSLDMFRRNFERVFDDFFSMSPSTLFESKWLPSVDVSENGKMITVKAEVPGMDEKDISVTLSDNVLTISGEKKQENTREESGKRYVMTERKYGSFSRSITLPEGIKADKIKASFTKGVLSVDIPKDESAQPRKIEIKIQ